VQVEQEFLRQVQEDKNALIAAETNFHEASK
jgi:hypothetical protein